MVIKVQGMSCMHCITAVEKELNKIKGLSDIKVKVGEASFNAPGNMDLEIIRNAIQEAGFEMD